MREERMTRVWITILALEIVLVEGLLVALVVTAIRWRDSFPNTIEGPFGVTFASWEALPAVFVMVAGMWAILLFPCYLLVKWEDRG